MRGTRFAVPRAPITRSARALAARPASRRDRNLASRSRWSASERVDRLGDAGLLRDDLLRSQGDPDRLLGRQPERFVVGVRVERLSAAEDRGERLDRGADDVVLWLLRREC